MSFKFSSRERKWSSQAVFDSFKWSFLSWTICNKPRVSKRQRFHFKSTTAFDTISSCLFSRNLSSRDQRTERIYDNKATKRKAVIERNEQRQERRGCEFFSSCFVKKGKLKQKDRRKSMTNMFETNSFCMSFLFLSFLCFKWRVNLIWILMHMTQFFMQMLFTSSYTIAFEIYKMQFVLTLSTATNYNYKLQHLWLTFSCFEKNDVIKNEEQDNEHNILCIGN